MRTDSSVQRCGVAYIDRKFVPIGEARISILDWGFLHSDATYDVVHVWKCRFFRLDDHINRFLGNVKRLELKLGVSRAELRNVLFKCVRKAELQDAYVEMICTRGIPATGSRDPRQCTNRFYAFAVPFVWIATSERQIKGVRLMVSRVQRIPDTSVDPRIKNYHWLDFVSGQLEAYRRGAEEVVLSDREGNITEGPGYNVFIVRNGRLFTPGSGVLEGITRRTVLDISKTIGITVVCEKVSVKQLQQADEIFITSTAGGVMSVSICEGRNVGNGKPGMITSRIQSVYWDWHRDARYSTWVR